MDIEYKVFYAENGEFAHSPSLEEILQNIANLQGKVLSVMFRGYTEHNYGTYTVVAEMPASTNRLAYLFAKYRHIDMNTLKEMQDYANGVADANNL